METKPERFGTVVAIAYVLAVCVWYLLHAIVGDRAWWLALVNAFAPFLFMPLILAIPGSLLLRWRRFRLATLVLIVIAAALYGELCLPLPESSKASGSDTLRIVSFNVWGPSLTRDTARAVLQGDPPDIIALQELSPRMADVFMQEMGSGYPYRHISDGPWHHRLGILSRYPLEPLDVSAWAQPNWRVQAARVDVDGRMLVVYNVHLAVSNALAYYDNGHGLGAQVAASYRGREAQATALMAQVAAQESAVIVLGDFNTTEMSDAYRTMTTRLTDVHRAVGHGLGHTFPSYGGRWKGLPILPKQLRLDMVLVSDAFIPQGIQVCTFFGESDHHPILAALGWRD